MKSATPPHGAVLVVLGPFLRVLRGRLRSPARSRGQGGAPRWTNDLDPGEDRRSVRRRWAWSDPVAKSRVWGCQPCRAASPREGLGSRAPVVAATSTPDLACPLVRAVVRAGRVGCQAAIVTR